MAGENIRRCSMISEPKPVSGASPQAAWLSQLLLWVKGWRVLQIEGFREEQTTAGRNFKKQNQTAQISASSPTIVLPFTVYQISNVLKASDSWRTFQMRDGLIGFRSKYFAPSQGNFEWPVGVFQDGKQDYSQPVTNIALPPWTADQQIILSNTHDTLISGYDTSNNPVGFYQFLPDNTWDSGSISAICFSVYVEIIDIPNSPTSQAYANLWGRMWTGEPTDPTGRPTGIFPAPKPNLFPIMYAVLKGSQESGGQKATGGTWRMVNYQVGNLVNRFPVTPSPETFPIGSALNFRDVFIPGQVYWPGDIVTDPANPKSFFIHEGVAVENDLVTTGQWHHYFTSA